MSLGIDVTDKINLFIEKMKTEYKEICIYPELQGIDEQDRFPLLECIYRNSLRIGFAKFIKDSKFPQYDSELLDYICAIESARVTDFIRMKNAIEEQKVFLRIRDFKNPLKNKKKGFVFVVNRPGNPDFKPDNILRLVKVEDMVKATFVYKDNKTKRIYYYMYSSPQNKIQDAEGIEKLFVFIKDKYVLMTTKEFDAYCEENNFENPLSK